MLDNPIQKALFHWTSQLTTWFPRGGARFFDSLVPPLIGNRALVDLVDRRNRAALRRVPKFERILVIPDIHIGDAVMLQGAAVAFRDHFPGARVDYVIKKSVACLIEGNPALSNLYPVFTGTVFPTSEDVESVKRLVAANRYDLCFNCSPFFEDRALFPSGQPILNFLTVAPRLVRNELDGVGPNHFLHQSYRFPDRLLQRVVGTKPRTLFQGASVYLSDGAITAAKDFLASCSFPPDRPLAFLNPDTASRYTLIPEEYQTALLKGLVGMGCSALVGAGFTYAGIEERLLAGLTEREREKVRFVPKSLPLDGYAALVDLADVFLSGDTGPLHIAAARKVSRSGGHAFRNRTFVISVFGATPARMSGYDSTDPLFPPAHQDAPSRTFVSESPCRNITCVNKMAKTCQKVRCYESLDTGRILADIGGFLRGNGLNG